MKKNKNVDFLEDKIVLYVIVYRIVTKNKSSE